MILFALVDHVFVGDDDVKNRTGTLFIDKKGNELDR